MEVIPGDEPRLEARIKALEADATPPHERTSSIGEAYPTATRRERQEGIGGRKPARTCVLRRKTLKSEPRTRPQMQSSAKSAVDQTVEVVETTRTELSQDWEACEPIPPTHVANGDETPRKAPETVNGRLSVTAAPACILGDGRSDASEAL